MTGIKTLIFTILVPGTIAVYIPYHLVSSASERGSLLLGGFRYAGLALMLIGTLIYLRCAWDFTFAGKGTPAPIDPPKELVVKGLYKYVRNPMYVGVMCVILGQAVLFESLPLFAYAAFVFVVFNCFVLLYEEPVLREKFGESYRRYCDSVPRWVPTGLLRRRSSINSA